MFLRISGSAEYEPEEFAVEKENGCGDEPGGDGREPGVDEVAHLGAVARELDQRNHRKRQLKAENHLAEDEQRGELPLPGDADDQDGREDGDRSGDEAAQLGLQADIQKTFHDDLAGERAGECGVLPGGEQRAGKQ